MDPSIIWKMRRAMGWTTVLLSVGGIGGGFYLGLRVLTNDLPLLTLIEPGIFIVFGLVIMPTALSFMDPRKSGIR